MYYSATGIVSITRRVFYSFHYTPDNWRASQVRNIGIIERNRPATDNDWETVRKGSESAIKKWIDEQMKNRSCTVVLIGSATAGRRWINHEIIESWNNKMGVVGIYIHGLEDRAGNTSSKGKNPFKEIFLNGLEIPVTKLSSVVECYDPAGSTSKECYGRTESGFENGFNFPFRGWLSSSGSRQVP